jgi:PAS domain S-box-containing protein
MHALLQRQLARLGLNADAAPDLETWRTLLARVDKAYSDADLDRYTLERSLDLSAEEMRAVYTELQTIVRSISEALIVTDEAGRVTMLNPAAERLLGWPAPDWRGKAIGEVLPLVDTRLAEQRFGGSAAAGRDALFCRRDGSEFAASTTRSELVREGVRTGEVYLLRDVTDRLRFEAELIRARDQARAASRSKSDFLANMSHEIRTPMNGVIGTTSLLLETSLSTEQREYVETIRSSGDLLLSILNDILDLSKIEAGKIEIDLHAFDPHTAVEDTIELFSASAERRNNEVVCDVASDVPRSCVGDLTRIRQVLSNLVSNAIKFTQAGEVVVAVRAEDVDAETVSLTFCVRDTGIGIPADRLGQLFRPFEQADASITRRFGGSGLGLAISRLLIERMGGRLWVESEPGRGSTFTFKLSLQRSADAALAAASPAPFGDGRRLLLVDDNTTNLAVIAGQLRSFGFEVHCAASGSAAMTALAPGGNFALAVLNHVMPEEDGVALARRIHGMPAHERLPLVLLGSGGAPTRSEHFAAILRKPCLPRLLRETLRRLVDGSPVAQQPHRRAIPHLAGERPLRILIAEDVAVNQKLAAKLLEKVGYRADCVGNGIEALEAMRRTDYDVVLMDCMMPEMDGLEATRAIRAERESGRPWIIAVTANVMSGDRAKCIEVGMNDFVAKPMGLDAVITALRAVPVAVG